MFTERTSVGLDVPARPVVAARIGCDTGEVFGRGYPHLETTTSSGSEITARAVDGGLPDGSYRSRSGPGMYDRGDQV